MENVFEQIFVFYSFFYSSGVKSETSFVSDVRCKICLVNATFVLSLSPGNKHMQIIAYGTVIYYTNTDLWIRNNLFDLLTSVCFLL